MAGNHNPKDPYSYEDNVSPSAFWNKTPAPPSAVIRISSLVDKLLRTAATRIQGLSDLILHRIGEGESTWMFDPRLTTPGRIHQPVEVRLERFLDMSAHSSVELSCLTMSSPILAKRSNIGLSTIRDLLGNYSLVQVCENPNIEDYAFPVSCRCTLPLLIQDGRIDNCSVDEVALCLEQLIHGAEYLEHTLAGNQDLSFADLQMIRPNLSPTDTVRINLTRNRRPPATLQLDKLFEWEPVGEIMQLHLANIDRFDANIFQIQHEHPFLFCVPKPGGRAGWYLRFPSIDFQASERSILEKWGRYILTQLRSSADSDDLIDGEE